jgi:hypothetical protein
MHRDPGEFQKIVSILKLSVALRYGAVILGSSNKIALGIAVRHPRGTGQGVEE